MQSVAVAPDKIGEGKLNPSSIYRGRMLRRGQTGGEKKSKVPTEHVRIFPTARSGGQQKGREGRP